MNTVVTPPELSKATQIAEQAYAVAVEVQIDSTEMYELAGSELRTIATRKKQIEDLRFSITRPMDEAKKRVMDLFRVPLERLEDAEKLVRGGMVTFQRAERDKAEQARREAEEAARIERERLAAEQRAAEESARQAREAAEAAAKAGDAEAAALAAEEAARAEAEAEHAQFTAELAEIAPVTLPAVEQPKAAGISTRQTWKAEVADFAALVIAAGEAAKNGDTTLLGYLEPNASALGQVAKALKGQARIPGVRVYPVDGLTVRRAA